MRLTVVRLVLLTVAAAGCGGSPGSEPPADAGESPADADERAADADEGGTDAGGAPSDADAGAPVEPQGPGDLDYYEVERIRSLTWEELRVEEVERTTVDDVEVIGVRYHAFDQTFATAQGSASVPWRQRALLCLPTMVAEPSSVRQGLLVNMHDAPLFGSTIAQHEWCSQVSRAYGLPVLLHGWEADVVEAIDGTSFHELQEHLLARLMERVSRAEDLPLDGRYLFDGFVLPKADMVSITLLQRLAEREWGATVEEVASLGISKAGHSQWVLATLDDRVAVTAPGGAYIENYEDLMEAWARDWGCALPNGVENSLFEVLLRFGDWLRRSEAGAVLDRLTFVEHWAEQIHARHVLVSGDLGVHEMFGREPPSQHDWAFPLLAENGFFERFAHPSWRYVRVPDGSGLNMAEPTSPLGLSLLPHAADLLTEGTTTPTTPRLELVDDGRALDLVVTSTVAPGLETKAVAVYAISPERTLRVPETDWAALELTPDGEGRWTGRTEPVPVDEGLTIIGIVGEHVVRGDLTYVRTASTLPVERFPLPGSDCTLPRYDE